MTQKTMCFVLAFMMGLTVAARATRGDDAERLAALKAEKAALEKRLTEIDVELDRIWAGAGVTLLGLTFVDTTKELRNSYDLPEKFPAPIISNVQDASCFTANTAPGEGCSLWLVENPGHSFFGQAASPTFHPKTIRQLVRAIVASTVSPEEYQAIYDQFNKTSLENAGKFEDNPEVRERLLKTAVAKVPADDVGKYICRVVYHYPKKAGTMTTHIRMNKSDLEKLQMLIKE